jgi:metal-responsive CopG/Arc/MetJ family transcriptional regulator
MKAIKTSISIEKNLLDLAGKTACSMKVSRSKLIAIALQEFIEHQRNKDLLAQINAAYDDNPDVSEQSLRRKALRSQRSLVKSEW